MKTRKDIAGRVWSYCQAEGAWICGVHVIGCGRYNVSKWQVWQGPSKDCYEYPTLKQAMDSCK